MGIAPIKAKLELEFEEEDETSRKEEAAPEDPGLDFTTSKALASKSLENPAANAGKGTAIIPMPIPAPAGPANGAPQSGGTSVRYLAELRKAKLNKAQFKKKHLHDLNKTNMNLNLDQTDANRQILEMPYHTDAEIPSPSPVPSRAEGIAADQLDAEIRVAIAEARGDMLAEFLSEAKLLEYKINHMLSKLNSKNPQVLKYISTIKQFLAEFVRKKY
jgi:hypothetical protein